MSKNYLQSLLFYALCFCLCWDVLFKNSRVAAQPAPVLNSLYPRRIPSTVGYVVLEGSNFGTNISNIAVTFSSTSGNSSPCSSLNQPFPSYLNCSLSLPNNLSNSTSYNIFISVGSQNSNSLPFQTGAFNTAPLIRDADFVMINKAYMTIYINAVDPDDNSELSRFLAIKPPGNGTTVPAMIASSPAFRVFNTDRTIRYTPNANFIGIDSFQVQALDQFNASE
ncbi:hypothetical protein BKA69DRAFT_839318 [Paraphysoderma sedebokerense]|nr:hypothetical protein BKA69DRAFT_839318 [Paraphysoderma sedebokerense]